MRGRLASCELPRDGADGPAQRGRAAQHGVFRGRHYRQARRHECDHRAGSLHQDRGGPARNARGDESALAFRPGVLRGVGRQARPPVRQRPGAEKLQGRTRPLRRADRGQAGQQLHRAQRHAQHDPADHQAEGRQAASPPGAPESDLSRLLDHNRRHFGSPGPRAGPAAGGAGPPAGPGSPGARTLPAGRPPRCSWPPQRSR